MPKKEALLGRAPLEGVPNPPPNGSLQLFAPERALTKDEQRTIDEFRKQRLVIEATEIKTDFGMTKIGEMHEHATVEFDDNVGYILEIKASQRGKEHQAYMDEFVKHQIQHMARNLAAAVEVGATGIGMEIHRSLYLLPEPPEPRSLCKMLFG